jgi:uncharacterized membrane protein YgdD (TMEM256/DUF423 family)
MTAFWIRAGALLGLLAVALGAFGAHALKDRLDEAAKGWWSTAVQYHFWHALALFAVAFVSSRWPGKSVDAAGWCFLLGALIFSGSLYAMSLTGARWLGAVTPLGGLLLLAGWLCLVLFKA